MKWMVVFSCMAASLFSTPKAVVFDFGNVMASPDPNHVIQFLSTTFSLNEEEFKKANDEKKFAMKRGISEENYWIEFGEKKGISMPENWADLYQAELKAALGINEKMYALVDELKAQVQVAMLSNIWESLAKRISVHGLYDPFEPCLLSYQMGVEKPDPKAYQLLLEALPHQPKEIVFIDDLPENVEAASALGLDAILFESAEQIRTELKDRGLL